VVPLHDELARVVLLAGLLVLLPITAWHRVRSITGEELDRRQEGLFLLLTLRPAGAACLLGLLAYVANPRWMAWAAVSLPGWVRWTGVGLGIAAGALLACTLRSLGRNLTDTVVVRKDHVLVTSGPYRWVRHPFYDAVALAALASALVAANAFLLFVAIAVFALFVVRTRREEQNLLMRFGDQYRHYVKRTGRFLPRAFRWRLSSRVGRLGHR
jgi:protein-S-isoprenylcysteine O-methyltransferase Ste14